MYGTSLFADTSYGFFFTTTFSHTLSVENVAVQTEIFPVNISVSCPTVQIVSLVSLPAVAVSNPIVTSEEVVAYPANVVVSCLTVSIASSVSLPAVTISTQIATSDSVVFPANVLTLPINFLLSLINVNSEVFLPSLVISVIPKEKETAPFIPSLIVESEISNTVVDTFLTSLKISTELVNTTILCFDSTTLAGATNIYSEIVNVFPQTFLPNIRYGYSKSIIAVAQVFDTATSPTLNPTIVTVVPEVMTPKIYRYGPVPVIQLGRKYYATFTVKMSNS